MVCDNPQIVIPNFYDNKCKQECLFAFDHLKRLLGISSGCVRLALTDYGSVVKQNDNVFSGLERDRVSHMYSREVEKERKEHMTFVIENYCNFIVL